jgi:hypothetical protein
MGRRLQFHSGNRRGERVPKRHRAAKEIVAAVSGLLVHSVERPMSVFNKLRGESRNHLCAYWHWQVL